MWISVTSPTTGELSSRVSPLVSIVSLVAATGIELSPGSLASPDRTLDPALPPLPSYVLGFDLGVEVGIGLAGADDAALLLQQRIGL